jgi:hypothetical protein
MFWVNLTINKVACKKTPSTLLGVFVMGFARQAARERKVLASLICLAMAICHAMLPGI